MRWVIKITDTWAGSLQQLSCGLPVYLWRIIGATFLLASCASASESLVATEDDFYSQLPVVLHATRLRQTADTVPASVTIIDRQMIEASSATSIEELLRYVPGFQLSHESGNRADSTFHGLSDDYSRRLQLLVNGRAIYDHAFGGIAWTDLPITLDDIERVEVVRGPNVAAQGASAFLGSINLVTVTPEESAGTMVRADYGSGDSLSVALRHAGQTGVLAYMLTSYYEENHGLLSQADDFQAAHINFNGNWRINDRENLEFGIAYRETKEEQGFAENEFDPLLERAAQSFYANIDWHRINATDDEWKVSWNYSRFDADDQFNDPALRVEERCALPPGLGGGPDSVAFPSQPVLATSSAKDDDCSVGFSGERHDLEILNIRRLNEAFRLVWGGGVRYDRVESPGYVRNGESAATQWRLFSNAEWSLSRSLLLNVGFMYEKPESLEGRLSSRVALNYHVNEAHSLRAIASRAWRTSFYENYENLGFLWGDGRAENGGSSMPISAEELGKSPERLDAIEFGYLATFPDQRVTLDIRLYHHAFTNFFHVFSDEASDIYANLYTFDYTGAEAQLRFNGQNNSLHLGYSNTAISRSGASDIINSMPEHSLNLLYTHRLMDDWQGSVSLFHVDELSWLDDEGTTDSVTWVDLKLVKSFKTDNGDLQLALTAQNIFDEPGVTLRQVSRGERFLKASIQYRF